jgi:EmrB/QacA subfamily drug resistance transporter
MATLENVNAAPYSAAARRPNLILAICCLALLLVTMDVTIVNVALPAIGRDLHASIAGLQWSIDGYTVAYGSFLMLAGALADRFGRRRSFLVGLVFFGVGSLLCSLATSVPVLVACRMIQALGGATINPTAMSIISHTFVDPKERARAIGVYGMMTGLSMALGPIAGGLLTQSFGWRSIFAVNVPVVIAAIALTIAYVPESRAPHARRFDMVGQALLVFTLGSFVGVLIEGPAWGWNSPWIIGSSVAVLAGFIAFLLYEHHHAEPLIELRFFRNTSFSAATAIAVLVFAAFNGFLFFNAFYLQSLRGMSSAVAGPCLLPAALAIVIGAPLSGRMAGAGRTSLALVISGAGIAAAAVLSMMLHIESSLIFLFAIYALFGIGLGMANAPITNTAVSSMPRHQAGVAAGLASTSRVIGASIGVALAGSVIDDRVVTGGGAGAIHAAQPLWWMLLACGALIVVLGALSQRPASRA